MFLIPVYPGFILKTPHSGWEIRLYARHAWPGVFLVVIDDGKVVRIPGEAKAREEWCAVCREREFCFSCMKKTPDGMIAIRGFV
ncbi:hypothetical protein CXT97_03105 [Akkermansia muciniphila]|nr:hypothetical protein CXT97_03105 [Akkermansia muciniphila]PNC98149.1 hypothetical protein CXT90_10170 [Akkermansia muciniphila]